MVIALLQLCLLLALLLKLLQLFWHLARLLLDKKQITKFVGTAAVKVYTVVGADNSIAFVDSYYSYVGFDVFFTENMTVLALMLCCGSSNEERYKPWK